MSVIDGEIATSAAINSRVPSSPVAAAAGNPRPSMVGEVSMSELSADLHWSPTGRAEYRERKLARGFGAAHGHRPGVRCAGRLYEIVLIRPCVGRCRQGSRLVALFLQIEFPV
jgi:hypothetical protein